jgi:GT2 family glycosyltransferase/MoaA/NifB/PqqE/SkfB family radical SAM enzyme
MIETKIKKAISIIIASYNRKDLLKKNLEAIDNQKFAGDLEVIVIDDGSTDGTLEMLKNKVTGNNKFVFKYFKTSHSGPANARNLGVANSCGDILIFLDDDTVVQNNDYVQRMVESFEEKGVGIVAGKTIDFYSGILKLVRAGDPPEINFNEFSKLKETVGVPTKNAAFLKEAFLKVGGFDPLFKYSQEDIDLCIRILNLGYKLVFNKEALVFHYPIYNFSSYVRKYYHIGYSLGLFHSHYPDKSPKFSGFKAAIFPLLSVKTFINKAQKCFSQKLFSRSVPKELAQMFGWIFFIYAAQYFGEIRYIAEKNWDSLKIRLKASRDLNKYFFETTKYFIKIRFLPQRRNFIFYLTNRCNQRCSHCFYSQDINKNISEFSLEEIKKIAKNYYLNTNTKKILARNICQGFTGGEPFLRNDLLDIISSFRKEGIKYFQINTNGMLTEKIVNLSRELLRQNVLFKIFISIDGLGKTHDKIRNTPGAFQKAIQTIKELKTMGAGVETIMTINKLNYKEIGEVMNFLNSNFNIEPGLQLIRGVSQSNAPFEVRDINDPLEKDILITKDIIPELRNILFKLYSEKSIKNPFKIAEFARKLTYLESHLDILEKRERIFDCLAGKSAAVIYQNGDVSLCEFYKPIGNLKEVNFNLPLLWNNNEARKQRELIKKCFCHHDCFINTEYNLRFAKHYMNNLNKFIALLKI